MKLSNDLIFHVYVFFSFFLPFYKEFLQGPNENDIKDIELTGEINVLPSTNVLLFTSLPEMKCHVQQLILYCF